jgi:predicted nucleotidyltransferase
MNTVQYLKSKNLISPPKWLPDNIMYETVTGSIAYGMSSDSSDYDVYGWCIPPKEDVFPHLRGEIFGFGKQIQRFEQFQQHGMHDPTALNNKGRTYDITIYSIVKYFQLCMENNPNMIDTLYTPYECVLHSTQVGKLVRDNRDIFLHKGCFHRFTGYAHAQLHKMELKNPEGKRVELIEKYGFDVKYASHLVRLAYECEMILTEGTLDLRRHNEHLKRIRRGEVPKEEILRWFGEKELQLNALYASSKLQHKPDEQKIKSLLLSCLETHYGTLDKCYKESTITEQAIREIGQILERYKLI